MSDVYPAGHVFVARAHDSASDWIPHEPHILDSMTGSPIAVAGALPLVCSAGFGTQAGRDLLGEAGLEPAPNQIRFRAGEELQALATADPNARLIMQHAYPDGAVPANRHWIDPTLLRYLNNKANLEALAPAEHCPPRRVFETEEYFSGEQPELPIVLKAATDETSGGGCAVMICRTGADLRAAREAFATCDRIVAEGILNIVRNPCLNFAVMPSGETRYLGFADQDMSAEGKYRGNWMDLAGSLPQAVIDPALQVVRRAAELGYRGLAGVDMAVTRDGAIYVLDLNFRMNASTGSLLLAHAIKERWGEVIMHLRKVKGHRDGRELAQSLLPFVRSGRLLPLCLFDAQAAGYNEQPSVQVLIMGASPDEVLATEAELAAAGIE
jgi:hypothetical protein